ncbi:MAG: PorV/PorQ family protein [Salibacteraceae bacterium]
MNTFAKISLIIFSICSAASFSFAQTVKYSNEFLAIGVGARALGMSKATVATVNDATSGYWNPAGLTGLTKDYSVSLMHSEYFAGIAKYDYASVATKLDDKSSIGFSYIRFGVDDIPNTINLVDNNGNINYNNITSFSSVDNAFLLSYARKTGIEGLSIGVNAKVIYRKIGSFAQAWGFGLDLAGQYELKKWKFGAVLRDATSTFNSWSYSLDQKTIEVFQATGNDIPENGLEITVPRVVIGVGREFEFKKFYILPELNFETTFDGQRNTLIQGDPVSIDPYFGMEVSYNKLVFIRGGVGNFQRVKAEVGDHKETTFQPNIGIGLSLKGVTIDYALTDIGDQSTALYSNVFSLKIDLNKQKK